MKDVSVRSSKLNPPDSRKTKTSSVPVIEARSPIPVLALVYSCDLR
jgi:hypothetical protein